MLEFDNFWNSNEPYEIASKVTGSHGLTNDLVSHVYLIIHDKDIKDIEGMFARVSYQQWNWSESEFNKLYNRYYSCDMDYLEGSIIFWEEHEEIEKKLLRDYLEEQPNTLEEWFTKELMKMRLCGMTYRDIERLTQINASDISNAIKIFTNDFLNYYYKCSDSIDFSK